MILQPGRIIPGFVLRLQRIYPKRKQNKPYNNEFLHVFLLCNENSAVVSILQGCRNINREKIIFEKSALFFYEGKNIDQRYQ
jgi:hypothetical protein